MSIQQFTSLPGITLYGDGTSTTTIVDMTNYLKVLNITPNVPSAVVSFSASTGITVTSATFNGAMLTLVFASAPPISTAFVVNLQVIF